MTRMKMIAALLLAATLAAAGPAAAQNKDFFVPGKPAAPAPHPVARPTPPPSAPGPGAAQQAPPPIPMPPVPELPALPKGAAPPAAVVGVIDVPEVMRASTAAQQVDRVISERRQKLSDDAQKEQGTWREMQQTLTNERAKLSPAQIRAKEQELQDRITKAQIEFRKRNEIIQEAAQVGLNQIQATLIAVIRQVAESRGMNLVLHRAQVALNINEFDVTQQVLTELNTILPSVVVPPEGVS
ncbi:MAG: OmpH family outer membrane protein, partial [Rhodospirillales bacterium]|nr:OmpH family outer membrane protein [Rhodospirillales bacterium]